MKVETTPTLGATLHVARLRKRLTLRAAGKAVGVSATLLSLIERDRAPANPALRGTLEDVLGINLAKFFPRGGAATTNSWPQPPRPVQPDTFGARLRLFRDAHALSIQALGKRARVSTSYLWRLELGLSKNPGVKILGRLASAFKVPVEVLLQPESAALLEVAIEANVEAEVRLRDAELSALATYRQLSDTDRLAVCAYVMSMRPKRS